MFFKLLLLFIFYAIQQAENQKSWSYDNARFWQRTYPLCGGRRQSPINIITRQLRPTRGQLMIVDYDVPFRAPLRMINNGHTASLNLGVTMTGDSARILSEDGIYIAVEMHFHWPSEHVINGQRFSAEVHIVHRNRRYRNMEQALQREDGVKVLTILLNTANRQNPHQRGLDPIFNRLSDINIYNRQVTLERGLSLNRFLRPINITRYYNYKGSLTTPPCAEAVEFYILPTPKPISADRIQRFYQLRDTSNRVLRFTNRPLQNLNNRPIFCRGC